MTHHGIGVDEQAQLDWERYQMDPPTPGEKLIALGGLIAVGIIGWQMWKSYTASKEGPGHDGN